MHKSLLVSLSCVILVLSFFTTVSNPLSAYTDQCNDENQKIAYVSDTNVDQHDIYVVDMNGNNRENLTQNSSFNNSPSWSPDGSQIAFKSNRDGNWQIYKMDQDGGHVKNLTNTKSDDVNPSWSPDGKQIAFWSNRDNPNSQKHQIYIMNSDGSDLVNVSNNAFHNYSPVWSPDSKQIAFMSSSGKDSKIVLADLANKTTQFLDVTADASRLSWSSDGKYIAFETRIDDKHKLYLIDSYGKELYKLTQEAVSDFQPEWAPIKSEILFWRDTNSNLDIYSMDMDGTNIRNLSQNAAQDSGGIWSPTGLHIAFETGRDRNGNTLYVMDSKGENPHKIADQVLMFSYTWQPCRVSPSN